MRDLDPPEAGPVQRNEVQISRRRHLAPHPTINLAPENPSVWSANRYFVEDGFGNRPGKVIRPVDGWDHGPAIKNGSKASEACRVVELSLVVFRPVTSHDDPAGLPALDLRVKTRWRPRHHVWR